MKTKLKKITGYRNAEGMTLIEVVIATAVLSIALISMAIMISLGFLQLNNMRVQRASANCARMIIEYLETMPPDVIYSWSPQAPKNGNFASGTGVASLNSFINSADTSCKQLSDTSDPLGKKVKLKYVVCPGCYASTQVGSTGLYWTTCYYFVKAKVTYNGVNIGAAKTVEYDKKYYNGMKDTSCVAPSSCGVGSAPPGQLKNCVF